MIWAKSESTNYLTTFTNGEQVAQSDTTPAKGGGNLGFRPHELLEAALAGCMNMTLRMAAEKHAIPLAGAVVTVSLDRGAPEGPTFEYQVELRGEITEAQREHLLASLASCPVRNTLSQALHFRLQECHVLQAKDSGDYVETLKAQVRQAFATTPAPDPGSIRGSSEGDEPVNERRYGGWTWFEAISGRFSGFTAAEAEAIVAYLRYKSEQDEFNRPKIEQALRNYWLPRLG